MVAQEQLAESAQKMSDDLPMSMVYLLRDDAGAVKIGCSQKPRKRRVPARWSRDARHVEFVTQFEPHKRAYLIEKTAHRILHDRLVEGEHEWFAVSVDDAWEAVEQATAWVNAGAKPKDRPGVARVTSGRKPPIPSKMIGERKTEARKTWADLTLTAAQAAAKVGVSVRTMYRLFGNRGVPTLPESSQ